MLPPRSILRPAIACLLAGALLVCALSGPAAARPIDEPLHDAVASIAADRGDVRTSSLAGTTSTPRQDLRSPDARDAANAERIARAMEQYYMSYGDPEPIPAPAPAPAVDDGAPWLPIGLALAAMLAVAAAAGTALRRVRMRRRHAATA